MQSFRNKKIPYTYPFPCPHLQLAKLENGLSLLRVIVDAKNDTLILIRGKVSVMVTYFESLLCYNIFVHRAMLVIDTNIVFNFLDMYIPLFMCFRHPFTFPFPYFLLIHFS